MEAKRLMKVTYQDLKKGIRLNAYADAVIWSEDPSPTLAGLRFGGYAEVVRGLTDAIYGGATIEIEDVDGSFLTLKSLSKQYRREVSHEGLYAEATLIAEDEIQESSKSQDEKSRKHAQKDDLFDDNVPQQDIPAHICYIFCHPGNEDELFQAIDQKSYVPMIPEYQDYVLAELKRRRILRPLRVRSLYQELEAWKLCCEAKDQNLVRVMEDGLKRGKIKIPGASPGPSLLDGVHSVTDYLNTFGVTVAERIKKLFVPLFDPAAEPLSGEVLDINEYVRAHAGYPLYDAQLAVAEAIKRKLGQSKVALIVAGCGTGKTKIGSVAVAAAGLQSHQISAGHSKTFSIVLCPAHVTKKWVREIEESIPNTFAAVVRSISEFDLLYKLYEQGSRNCFAIISKEKARDGYMRAPAVIFRKWNREGLNIARPRANEEMPAVGFSPLRHVFCCPDCGAVIMENISKDGVAYRRGDASFGQQLELATTELERYRKALSELHGGEPRIITKGKLPDSHIVFLDEIFKASDGILNALLTALNERRYTNEGKTIHIPTISFFSASNEIPNFTNPEEKILKPLYDRFELKVVTEYVEDRAARLKILKQKQAAPHLAQAPAAPITLEELEAMQDDVRQVHILDSINELMDDVLCALREKGIHISDRKYFNYAPVAQAKAWLEGRDTVAPADLIILRHYLWTAPEERAIIQSALVQMCSDPFKNRLDGILAAAQESYQEFEDDSGAAPARRIGKLREEYLMLYEKLSAMRAEAQDDIGRQKVDACMEDLEAFNKKAFSEDGVSGVFSYVPLKELYLLKAN